MNYRRYLIKNVKLTEVWRTDAAKLDFKRSGKRLTKRHRKQANEAVATLKGIGWLRPHQYTDFELTSVTVELNKLELFIIKNHHEAICRFGVKDSVVVMGSMQFRELTNSLLHHPMMFPLADFQTGHMQNRLHGLSVVVLPWMDGTLLIPKEYLPIDRELVPSGVMVTAETQRKLDEEAEGLRDAAL